MKDNQILLGCHVGFNQKNNYLIGSINEAISYKANCFMIFSGPNQSFKRKPIDVFNVKKAFELIKDKPLMLNNIIVHAPYLINLASPKQVTRELSCNQLVIEINRSYLLGSKLLVLHPGSCVNTDRNVAIKNIVDNLNIAIDKTKKTNVIICIETMAGKGSEMGINFKEISEIINGVKNKDRIGVCFDTCHLFDSGIKINNLDSLINEFNLYLPTSFIKVIHLNDSKNEFNSKKDRHANIGMGKIGFDILVNWVFNKTLSHIPKILETPYLDNLYPIYDQEIFNLKNKNFKPYEKTIKRKK